MPATEMVVIVSLILEMSMSQSISYAFESGQRCSERDLHASTTVRQRSGVPVSDSKLLLALFALRTPLALRCAAPPLPH